GRSENPWEPSSRGGFSRTTPPHGGCGTRRSERLSTCPTPRNLFREGVGPDTSRPARRHRKRALSRRGSVSAQRRTRALAPRESRTADLPTRHQTGRLLRGIHHALDCDSNRLRVFGVEIFDCVATNLWDRTGIA